MPQLKHTNTKGARKGSGKEMSRAVTPRTSRLAPWSSCDKTKDYAWKSGSSARQWWASSADGN